MGNVWDKGDEVRCEVEFTDVDDAPTDPDSVFCKVKNPLGVITSFQYVTDPELVKVTTGNYYLDVDVDEVGMWYYRFYSTGNGKAAGEKRFKARETQF